MQQVRRFSKIRLMAQCQAVGNGVAHWPMKASTAWVSASMPVAAVMGRQPCHQRGVERAMRAAPGAVHDHQLALALGVGDDGGHRHFRNPCRRWWARRRWHRRAQAPVVAGQRAQALRVGDGHRHRLRGVDGTAAAHGDECVAVVVAVSLDGAPDQRNGRVGRDLVEHRVLGAAGGQCVGQAFSRPSCAMTLSVTISSLRWPVSPPPPAPAGGWSPAPPAAWVAEWQQPRHRAGAFHQRAQPGAAGGPGRSRA